MLRPRSTGNRATHATPLSSSPIPRQRNIVLRATWSRNGGTPKTVLTDQGRVRIDVPRDRNSEFEPQLVKKGQRRLAGLGEKIIALYAGGMTTREIEAYIRELYGPGVSRETVSRVTAAVLEDAKACQTRPLEAVYPIVYLDALVIKIRDGQAVRNIACYLAISFPSEDSARKLLYLAITRAQRKRRQTYNWSAALIAFRIHFGDRIPDTA